MTNQGVIKGKKCNIPYEVDYGKRKNMYITVKEGKVLVKVPLKTRRNIVEELVVKKSNWIEEKYLESIKNRIKPKEYKPGEEYWILGRKYTLVLKFTYNKSSIVTIDGDSLVITLPEKMKGLDYRKKLEKIIHDYYLSLGKEVINERIRKLSDVTGLTPENIAIKNMKRSWGRCSSNGNLSFNLELMKYDIKAIDYVVLHELCHLQYMNHSKDFWNLVESYMPNYKDCERLLKKSYE